MGTIVPIIVLLGKRFEENTFTLDWILFLKTGLYGAISYLTKNLLTNSRDEFLKSEFYEDPGLGGSNPPKEKDEK